MMRLQVSDNFYFAFKGTNFLNGHHFPVVFVQADILSHTFLSCMSCWFDDATVVVSSSVFAALNDRVISEL
jgi:hypothetical protein